MENEKILLDILKSLSIMYIEDEDRIRKDMVETLNLLCNKVHEFKGVTEALDAYDNINPHIIFSDISLEDSTGLELAKTIREFDKKIPIILLSAHTDTKYLLEAAKLKLVAYLTKPISFEELKSTLLEAVDEIDMEDKSAIFTISNNIVYNTYHKILYQGDQELALSKKELILLELLIKNNQKTVPLETIKSTLWDDPFYVTESALKAVIHKLRTKIGKDTVKNLSGVGYYLNLN
jgi:two-component system, OmpR family, response regulator VanR